MINNYKKTKKLIDKKLLNLTKTKKKNIKLSNKFDLLILKKLLKKVIILIKYIW